MFNDKDLHQTKAIKLVDIGFWGLKKSLFFYKWPCVMGTMGVVYLFKWNTITFQFIILFSTWPSKYQNFSSVFDISQGCDHVVKALGLNCKVHNYCFCEGASLLALFILILVLMFSNYKLQLLSFMCCLLIFKVQKVFFALVASFQVIVVLLFLLVFMFSSYNHLPLCIGLIGLKLLPSSFSRWSSCFQVSTNFLSCWSSCY